MPKKPAQTKGTTKTKEKKKRIIHKITATPRVTTTQPSKAEARPSPATDAEPLTTGIEDYAHWLAMFPEDSVKGHGPFRRGRIWA